MLQWPSLSFDYYTTDPTFTNILEIFKLTVMLSQNDSQATENSSHSHPEIFQNHYNESNQQDIKFPKI